MKKWIQTFMLAVLSGLAIGVGGTVYLSMENKIVGALMFTIGLVAICTQSLILYTGKVGYLFENKPSYLLDLLVIWLGNWAGVFIMAMCILNTRNSKIAQVAKEMCEMKLKDNYLSLFLLAIFCGMLMYIAVDGYKKTEGNMIVLFMGVGAFIFCGFEHCIADMFYFSIAQMWSAQSVLAIIIISLGNGVGGVLIPLTQKLVKTEA